MRSTLYLLLGERLVELVPHNRSLTVRVTAEGRLTIEQITEQWAIQRVALSPLDSTKRRAPGASNISTPVTEKA